jgi:hypothetical protein
MNVLLAIVLGYGAVIGPKPKGVIVDSYICENVTLKDFARLTDGAKLGKTHLALNGSGFFITEDGYLFTNYHVVEDAVELVVVKDGVAYLADVVAKTRKHDLALLKINAFPRTKDGIVETRKLPRFVPLKRSDESSCRVGETVYVVGYPQIDLQGLEPKVTRGIVSSLSGFKGEEDNFQMDAAIQHGNSGGPVVDEYGRLVGVAVAFARGQNVNYAVKLKEVVALLPQEVELETTVVRRRKPSADMIEKVVKSTALVLNYQAGSVGKFEDAPNDTAYRERQTMLRKSILAARMCKLRRDWNGLKSITDGILERHGEVDDVKDMNDLARDELGFHLTIFAEVEGCEVKAHVTPICGFRDLEVECEKATAVSGGSARRGFPIEAKLSYEDDEWIWSGTLKCVYDWHGTKEVRVIMKRSGKKL